VSYSPPLYTAVIFDGAATAYAPPLYTAVNFDDYDYTTIFPNGIASAEAFGAYDISVYITPTGIASAEAFGTYTIVVLSGARGALLMHVENGITQLTRVFW
jgi:hypothetical protein